MLTVCAHNTIFVNIFDTARATSPVFLPGNYLKIS